MFRTRLIILIFLILSGSVFAQNETKVWCFGEHAGLDFSQNPPTVLNNNMMFSYEGCTCICDHNGNLLFYTIGDTVWNGQHQIMPNGTGLLGGWSVTQSSLIVKKPGSSNIYYLFTLSGAGPPTQLYYSTIDMSLASGNGSVTVKNTWLQNNCNEKMAASLHCNGNDVWVLVHEHNGANFYSFLVTQNGVNPVPVVSQSQLQDASLLGQMKLSPNGRKLGMAAKNPSNERFMLFDFNTSNGTVSNALALISSTNNAHAYGCEFSNDGTKFYGTFANGPQATQLIQWNLCAGTASAIIASSFVTTYTPLGSGGSMQLASNGKIYLTCIFQTSLSVIQNPNNLGSASSFSFQSLSLAPCKSKSGLPNFVSTYFRQVPAAFTYTPSAAPVCRTYSFTSPQLDLICPASNYTGLSWQFGDPASGISNSSSQQNPVHIFSNGGSYQVKLLLQGNCQTDTLVQTINVQAPVLSTNGNFSICPNQSLTLSAAGANTYSWSTGSQSSSITVSPSITSFYTVTGTSTLNSCSSIKVLSVTVLPCTGLSSYDETNYFVRVQPNPSTGIFQIELVQDAEIEVRDLRGIKVYSAQFLEGISELDLAQQADGLYILKIKSESGHYFLRLLKQ